MPQQTLCRQPKWSPAAVRSVEVSCQTEMFIVVGMVGREWDYDQLVSMSKQDRSIARLPDVLRSDPVEGIDVLGSDIAK